MRARLLGRANRQTCLCECALPCCNRPIILLSHMLHSRIDSPASHRCFEAREPETSLTGKKSPQSLAFFARSSSCAVVS